jgi:hypothetical protein
MMRWSLTKKAWELARESFRVDRLYVNIPTRLRLAGTCEVFDLDNPGKPIGSLRYKVVSSGSPHVVLSVEEPGKPRYMVSNVAVGALSGNAEEQKKRWGLEVTSEMDGSPWVAMARSKKPMSFERLQDLNAQYGRDATPGDRCCFVVGDTNDGSSHLMWAGDGNLYPLAGPTKARLPAPPNSASLAAPRVGAMSFDVDACVEKPPVVGSGPLVASRYGGAELHEKLAMLMKADAGHIGSIESVEAWLGKERLPLELAAPVGEVLGLRPKVAVAHGRKFKQYDRARINAPLSMEHQECAQVVATKGSNSDGYWYLVLVDGSSVPSWFPEDCLQPVEAGKPPEQRE